MTSFLIPVLFLSVWTFPDTAQVAPPPVAVVHIWGDRSCRVPCRNAKADIQKYTALDFRYSDKPSERPEWLKKKIKAGEGGFPYVYWYAGPKRGWVIDSGWTDLATFINQYNASRQ